MLESTSVTYGLAYSTNLYVATNMADSRAIPARKRIVPAINPSIG